MLGRHNLLINQLRAEYEACLQGKGNLQTRVVCVSGRSGQDTNTGIGRNQEMDCLSPVLRAHFHSTIARLRELLSFQVLQDVNDKI